MRNGKNDIVYLIGIGGIGMSALARWYKHAGDAVYGYDKTPTPLTDQLAAEGIQIVFDDAEAALPEQVSANPRTKIIYTPAVPKSHPQLNYFLANGYDVRKRSDALGDIARDHFTIAVAGTHGKTTTSTMIAHILHTAGKNCAAFLGGVSANYGTNFLLQGDFSADTVVVAEADEYDRSFLKLSPNIAVITSLDADHLDIYGGRDQMIDAYREFAGKVAYRGDLFLNYAAAGFLQDIREDIVVHKYGLEKGSAFASDIRINHGEFLFDLNDVSGSIMQMKLQVPGFHNVENATAAAAVALALGVEKNVVKEALYSFLGVKRRFEYIIKKPGLVFIDDYAHHPTEIEALLKSVKALYPGRKATVIFQPHLYSRTRDFADGFARSLSLADEILLLDIYPAREEPIEGVSSEMILEKASRQNKRLVSADGLLRYLEEADVDVALTVGAGDIDKLIEPIKNILNTKIQAR